MNIILEMNFCILILVLLFIISSIDKTLTVYNLCEKIRPSFAEIFGQRMEIDQNSNWQKDQNELNSEDSIGNDQNNDQFNVQQKREIVHKFHAIKDGMKKKGKYSAKIWNKIEQKIAEKLGISRKKIYKWKKEFGLNKYENYFYKQKKKDFVERIDEIERMSKNGKQKQFAKELGIGEDTLRKWKKELGIEIGKNGIRFSNEEKISKMNDYYKMKNENPILTDIEIAGLLKISSHTLINWKKQ